MIKGGDDLGWHGNIFQQSRHPAGSGGVCQYTVLLGENAFYPVEYCCFCSVFCFFNLYIYPLQAILKKSEKKDAEMLEVIMMGSQNALYLITLKSIVLV